MWYEWFFNGIGTELVSLVTGLVLGSIFGYKTGIRHNSVQKQQADNGAKQTQRIDVDDRDIDIGKKVGGVSGNLQQIQKAGKNAEQNQIGTIK